MASLKQPINQTEPKGLSTVNEDIQIGIPCVNEVLCFWAGVGFAVLVVGFIGAVIFSVLRERYVQQKKRKQRRSARKAKSQTPFE